MEQMLSQNNDIKQLTEFLQGPMAKVCFVEGGEGFFKTYFVDKAIETISDSLIFRIKCFEYTTLDDIFLSLLDDLKNFAKEKRISFAKLETKKIAERISHYLSHLNIPSILIVDSLENVLCGTSQKDKDEIIRFLEHLTSLRDFRLVLISSTFPSEFNKLFENKTFSTKKIKMQPLTKSEMKMLFEQEGYSTDEESLSYFFEITNGNPSYVFQALNILSNLNVNLLSLLSEFNTKQLSFNDFLIQKLQRFIPENSKLSIKILSVFNGGLPVQFLVRQKLFSNEQIEYLVKKGILAREYGYVFVKKQIKNFFIKSMPNIEKSEYHAKWISFYNSLLPLKPKERTILISRNTMRAQIEYHNSLIEKKKKPVENKPNMSLISYLNSDIAAWNIKKINDAPEDVKVNTFSKKDKPKAPDSIKRKKSGGLEKYELTKDEIALLGLPVDLTKQANGDAVSNNLTRTQEQREDLEEFQTVKAEPKKKDIVETLELAKSMEAVHNFETAASLYLQIMDQPDSDDFEKYYSEILESLAYCCVQMNKTSEAIDFYNRLIDFYSQKSAFENVNDIKLKIAEIYQKTYKLNHAKVIYENFLKNQAELSDFILLRVFAGLAGIEEQLSETDKALEHYDAAFDISKRHSLEALNDENIRNLLVKSYYKYALIQDDFNRVELAVEYYQKCIDTAMSVSEETSLACINIAEIFMSEDDITNAKKYYEQALAQDIELSNFEGIYYIALKMAGLCAVSDRKQILDWLLKSLSAAKKTKDSLYITNAYLEIGDYYSNNNEQDKAFKYYMMARKLNPISERSSSNNNVYNIQKRIEKIKSVLQPKLYEKIMRDFEQNE